MNTTLTVNPLVDLAKRINEQHRACEQAMNAGLRHAIEAGRLLVEAKEQVEHGKWGKWVEDNFQGSYRTVRSYMQVARRRADLNQNGNGVATLSYREGLKVLAEPKAEGPDDHIESDGTSLGPMRTTGTPSRRQADPQPEPPAKVVDVEVQAEDEKREARAANAMNFADSAITQAERITDKDPDREKALVKIEKWARGQRLNEGVDNGRKLYDADHKLIPDTARAAALGSKQFDRGFELLKELRAWVKATVNSPAGWDLSISRLAIYSSVRNIKEMIKEARLVCVCPYCEGRGCTDCAESGMVTKEVADQATPEADA